MTNKKTLGWNPTYFGEPKKGSLAAVIADVTEKQNAVVGEKPEVQSSAAVQAKEAQNNQEAMNPAAAIAISKKEKGQKPKDEEGNAFGKALQAAKEKGEKTFVVAGKKYNVEDADEMRDKNKKDAKGEKSPVKVHGEDLNAEIEKAKMSKVKSLVDTIKDMFYTETNKNDKSDDGDGLDAVQPKAVKKKFKDRKDKDIDNDGDVDSSDKFLHKRRKAISKAVGK